MWAAFRNNIAMLDFLTENGADLTLEDNKGWNALDISIIRMNYESALNLTRRGM